MVFSNSLHITILQISTALSSFSNFLPTFFQTFTFTSPLDSVPTSLDFTKTMLRSSTKSSSKVSIPKHAHKSSKPAQLTKKVSNRPKRHIATQPTLPKSTVYLDPHFIIDNMYSHKCTLPDNIKLVTVDMPTNHQTIYPEARHFDLAQFSNSSHGKPNAFAPTPEAWEMSVKKLGISKEDTIICVDQSGHLGAPRLFWYLLAGGVPADKLRIAMGGLESFDAIMDSKSDPICEHRPEEWADFNQTIVREQAAKITSDNMVKFNPASFKKYAISNEELFTIVETQKESIDAGKWNHDLPLVIDTRGAPMFAQGHMVGALNLPYPSFLSRLGDGYGNGMFVDVDDLAPTFTKILTTMVTKNPSKKPQIIFSCQTAQTASTGFVAMYQWLKQNKDVDSNAQFTLDTVDLKVYDSSYYIYGNPNIQLDDVPNCSNRRFLEAGPSSGHSLFFA